MTIEHAFPQRAGGAKLSAADSNGGGGKSRPGDAPQGGSTVDLEEVAKFSAMAEAWWDPHGSFRPLHRLNPVRIGYICERVERHFGRTAEGSGRRTDDQLMAGLSALDIGCGGGLLAEPLARLGAATTGIDASERNIAIARTHAAQTGVKVTYLPCAAEDLVATGHRYDIVLAMEVIEHVSDPAVFLRTAAELMKPDGIMFIATLNRTLKSYAFAIIGAEYVLRWLPRGTHDWHKFLRPSEIAGPLRQVGLDIRDLSGVTYQPINDRWARSRDTDVNYMLCASR
ncbi:bifunctional 2-polyprenyl-6-hydroxyphenol methylase/3-demethylubiquinol 3-O-methyltransferase UbiG [Dongia soli]|uniref:Ubiquinone biosynthesis O-methyltransferase n=1 Tax=Dongia soli TaxID=600628 RepID=A0ABU5E857_9PROT|nr:bifunctional 2-polyprenyl-6-hydroxyphenol methylase/3-demethylubiquinol 3-O-methyltransferase UbiG [Dongia soli]MDY0882481.1 bifunctional 2-polyprenyl-6-hydroxyphenol methylase/3-demethylubiquinol 3-O-methyltransferase UbiG [Dongia soli]